MSKTLIIALVVLLVLFSAVVGFTIGTKTVNPGAAGKISIFSGSNDADLTAIEAKLKKSGLTFPEAPANDSMLSGKITKIDGNTVAVSAPARTIHDVLFDVKNDYQLNVTAETKIYAIKMKVPGDIGTKEIKLPDGKTIKVPGDPTEKTEVKLANLKTDQFITVKINPEDKDKDSINALEISFTETAAAPQQ